MINLHVARGIVLLAIAVAFGIPSLSYQIGSLSHPGPGMFPLIVSCLLGVVASLTLLKSASDEKKFAAKTPKNILVILGSLVAFSLVSHLVNMALGIVALVFIASLANSDFSFTRSTKLALALTGIAFGFHKFLDLNLPLL